MRAGGGRVVVGSSPAAGDGCIFLCLHGGSVCSGVRTYVQYMWMEGGK